MSMTRLHTNQKVFEQPLDFREFRFWPLYVYDVVHGQEHRRLVRLVVTVSYGVAEYLMGFAIAAASGLINLYVRSPAFYLLAATFAFGMGRAKWASIEIIRRIAFMRDAFLVSDITFYRDIKKAGKRASPSRFFPMTILLIALVGGWIAVGLATFAPHSAIGVKLVGLEPSALGREWFTGSSRFAKMLIINVYLTCGLVFIIPVFFGTLVLVVQLPGLLAKWPLVPIPAYVSTRLRVAQTFFLTGTLVYAVDVLVLVLIYGGILNPPFIVLVSLLVLIGVLCTIVPPYAGQRMIIRSRDQLSSAVSADYRNAIQPMADGSESGTGTPLDIERLARLLKLQELMQAANQTSGLERQIGVILPAVLGQGIPYLGFLLSAFLKHAA